MDIKELHDLLAQVHYPQYRIEARLDISGFYLQASYYERCVVTGELALQTTRKWRLSEHMTKSEIVQTAFKCILTSAEHRVREHFRYRGELVYGPHFDVDALYELARARRLDTRPEWPTDPVVLVKPSDNPEPKEGVENV